MNHFLLFRLFSFFVLALPVDKCTLTDKACMLPAVQKMLPVFISGMPENDVEVLDPMTMPHIKFDLSGLQFTLDEGILKGLKKATVTDAA